MLSADTLEKLLQPFIDRQEALNTYVISIIADRIKEIGKLEPSDVYRLQVLFKNGSDVRKINEEIARVANIQVSEVKALIQEAAMNEYILAKPFYDYRMKPFIPFAQNKPMQMLVDSISRQTQGTFKNMSKATAFMMRDKTNRNKFIPTSISDTYQKVIDEAVQKVQQGVEDVASAMSQTIIDLGNSGIRYVNYDTPTGRIYTQRLDTAVRRNLLGGVRAVNQGIQEIIGEQIDADGIELSAHLNSAPDHEPIQGRQFTNDNFNKMQNGMSFESYQAKGQSKMYFEPIRRPIGEWNCGHFITSIILGVMSPALTDQQLQQYIDKNHKGYTTRDGRKMTMYECTQMQRKYETAIRKMRDILQMADKAGNEPLKKRCIARIKELTKQYNQFSRACGLSPKPNRIYVTGVQM